MCQSATRPGRDAGPSRTALRVLSATLALALLAGAQTATAPHPDWRHIGNSLIEMELASSATGPAERVWFSQDGARLLVRTASGRVFETSDFETWRASTASAPPREPDASVRNRPEQGGGVRTSPADPRRLYAYGSQVFRSDDGGSSWANVTSLGRRSIIGGAMRDMAVSPGNAEELVVANEAGVWRSLDGGISWSGLNDGLPNLPARRFTSLPRGANGVRVLAASGTLEWAPGEKQAWRPVNDAASAQEAAARRSASTALGAEITAVAAAGDVLYAGSSDGRLWVSFDKGRTWGAAAPTGDRSPIESIYTDPRDPRLALAVKGTRTGTRVLRTINAGQFWDDLTADLPEGAVHGVAADRASGTVYVASDRGVFLTRADLNAAAPATPWTAVQGLPQSAAYDVRLDADGNQLFVILEGYGVYAALAPHRVGSLRLVNAADFSRRAAAPGSLLSVLGGRVRVARAGDASVPVLAATEEETQIQVPFGARGSSLSLALETGQGTYRLAVPLEAVSPAVFVDRDGTPLVTNADSGVLLDAMNTAHSNARIQILMTGLGRTRPEWPSGVAGPLDNPPQVIANVRAYLDRAPVEVTRAVLAPGYIGLYLVEVQLPAIVNAGPAELSIESEGRESNRVRIWIEP